MIRRHPLAVLIVVVLIAAAAWELPNYLRKGSLKTYPCGSSACEILVFVDQAPTRQTGIFYSKEDSHLALDVLDSGGVSLAKREFGSLRWTADRSALVAVELAEGGVESGNPIWVFDTVVRSQIAEGRLGLIRVVESRGGLGDRIFSWYDLGEPGRYQFSWQAKKWRQRVQRALGKGETSGE